FIIARFISNVANLITVLVILGLALISGLEFIVVCRCLVDIVLGVIGSGYDTQHIGFMGLVSALQNRQRIIQHIIITVIEVVECGNVIRVGCLIRFGAFQLLKLGQCRLEFTIQVTQVSIIINGCLLVDATLVFQLFEKRF